MNARVITDVNMMAFPIAKATRGTCAIRYNEPKATGVLTFLASMMGALIAACVQEFTMSDARAN